MLEIFTVNLVLLSLIVLERDIDPRIGDNIQVILKLPLANSYTRIGKEPLAFRNHTKGSIKWLNYLVSMVEWAHLCCWHALHLGDHSPWNGL